MATKGGKRQGHAPKHNYYFPPEVIEQIEKEAKRLDRSLTWLLERAWVIARDELRTYPSDPRPEARIGGRRMYERSSRRRRDLTG